jgi:mannose-6-phosphate isomerase-like protein (cupin superfamily)
MVRRALTLMLTLVCAGCVQPAPRVDAGHEARHVRNRFWVRHDTEVLKLEPSPHNGTGESRAYRYFDDVPDQRLIFRKRSLPRGGSIGMHVLTHDEVYYVVSGRGEVRVDDKAVEVGENTAIFMHEGADVGIWQRGEEELVLIIAYPPATR